MGDTPPREITVQLGDKTYNVVPQRHTYLDRNLPEAMSGLGEIEAGVSALSEIPKNAYGVLKVFIPDLMPLHEYMGFASADAMEQDRYNEADDHAPDNHQIVEALKAGFTVNRFDLVKHLKDLIGPKVIQMALGPRLAEAMADLLGQQTETISGGLSGNGSLRNGESAPTSSSTPAPTSASSVAGPSPA